MSLSKTPKGTHMELMITTLILATLATAGHLRDAMGRGYGKPTR